jgi:hypothetical protein
MTYIDVTNQAQLDKALKTAGPSDIIVIKGSRYFNLSDSASVTASGSASVRAYDSASVTAYDSASVRAYDSASVTASGSASVTASKYVSVHTNPTRWGKPKVSGGVLIEVPEIKTPTEWLDYHGVEVKRGVAILFKAVDDDYSTSYARRAGIFYTPGAKPEAPDWNGLPECGGGIHVSPRPVLALAYNSAATRYVACPVKVADLVLIDDKAKAPRIARPVYEVDIDGERIVAEAAA